MTDTVETNTSIEQVSKTEDNLPVEVNNSLIIKETEDLKSEIMKASNEDDFKSVLGLINLLQAKKEALRVIEVDNLIDDVIAQAKERITKRPGEFSNVEIIQYIKTLSDQKTSSRRNIVEMSETPMIQINNTKQELNINMVDGMSRESKEKVIDVVQKILNSARTAPNTEETIDTAENLVYNSTDGLSEGENDD